MPSVRFLIPVPVPTAMSLIPARTTFRPSAVSPAAVWRTAVSDWKSAAILTDTAATPTPRAAVPLPTFAMDAPTVAADRRRPAADPSSCERASLMSAASCAPHFLKSGRISTRPRPTTAVAPVSKIHPLGCQERRRGFLVSVPPPRGPLLLHGVRVRVRVGVGDAPPLDLQFCVELLARPLRVPRLLGVIVETLRQLVIDDVQEPVEGEFAEINSTSEVLSVEFVPDAGLDCPSDESADDCVGRMPYSPMIHSRM